MNWRAITVAAIFVAGLVPASAAESFSVQSLYVNCREPQGSALWALCMGYVSGVGSLMEIIGTTQTKSPPLNLPGWGICGKPTNGAMLQAFINWAQANPKYWNTPQLLGVAMALGKTWPCQ